MDRKGEKVDMLNIRYVKLRFVLRFLEHAALPAYKASTIRGGIGEMLLKQHCINDRICSDKEKECEYAQECIVQRIMYASPEEQLDFMQRGNSVGYVIECSDYHTDFEKDNTLTFQLLLFGKNIVYFNEYLQAIHLLGMQGLGKEKGRFRIEKIFNQKGESLLSDNNILLQRYRAEKVSDYALRRKNELLRKGDAFQVVLKTPLSVKYRGEVAREIEKNALKESLMRRLLILNCFEGHNAEMAEPDSPFPVVTSQEMRPV